MIKTYVTLRSQGLDWLWHFGLVTFFCSIQMVPTLFLLAVQQMMTYISFILKMAVVGLNDNSNPIV